MPHYDYECAQCGPFVAEQRITAPRLAACPKCGAAEPKRLISGTAEFALKEGPSGSWSSGGYGHTPAQLNAMRKLGKLTRRA